MLQHEYCLKAQYYLMWLINMALCYSRELCSIANPFLNRRLVRMSKILYAFFLHHTQGKVTCMSYMISFWNTLFAVFLLKAHIGRISFSVHSQTFLICKILWEFCCILSIFLYPTCKVSTVWKSTAHDQSTTNKNNQCCVAEYFKTNGMKYLSSYFISQNSNFKQIRYRN